MRLPERSPDRKQEIASIKEAAWQTNEVSVKKTKAGLRSFF